MLDGTGPKIDIEVEDEMLQAGKEEDCKFSPFIRLT